MAGFETNDHVGCVSCRFHGSLSNSACIFAGLAGSAANRQHRSQVERLSTQHCPLLRLGNLACKSAPPYPCYLLGKTYENETGKILIDCMYQCHTVL